MQELLEHKHRVKSRHWLAGERRRTRGRAALGPSCFLSDSAEEETVCGTLGFAEGSKRRREHH